MFGDWHRIDRIPAAILNQPFWIFLFGWNLGYGKAMEKEEEEKKKDHWLTNYLIIRGSSPSRWMSDDHLMIIRWAWWAWRVGDWRWSAEASKNDLGILKIVEDLLCGILSPRTVQKISNGIYIYIYIYIHINAYVCLENVDIVGNISGFFDMKCGIEAETGTHERRSGTQKQAERKQHPRRCRHRRRRRRRRCCCRCRCRRLLHRFHHRCCHLRWIATVKYRREPFCRFISFTVSFAPFDFARQNKSRREDKQLANFRMLVEIERPPCAANPQFQPEQTESVHLPQLTVEYSGDSSLNISRFFDLLWPFEGLRPTDATGI